MAKKQCQTKIRFIYFDLGRVILPIDNKRRMAHKLSKHSRFSFGEILSIIGSGYTGKHRDFWDFVISFDCGLVSTQEFYEKACQFLKLKIGYKFFRQIWQEMFSVDERFVGLIHKIENVELGIISDLSAWHYEEVARLLPLSVFSICFYSFIERRMKKDFGGETFSKAIRFAACDAEQIIFIDDRKENIDMADANGMKTFHYKDNFDDFIKYLRKQRVKLKPL